ncbi:MAG: AAA family ATPase [Chitinophagaceae bacterium]
MAAPTGRAARILGRKTKTVSNTIHSLIYSVDTNKETGVVNFQLKKNKQRDFCIYVIDEASMLPANKESTEGDMFQVDDSLLNHLVQFLKAGNPKNKVIFLGDRNQLPPINETDSLALNPNYLRKKFNWQGSFHYLTEVKRQVDGSYILKNANTYREAIDNKEYIHPQIEAYRHRNIFVAAKEFALRFNEDNPDEAIAIGISHKANRLFNDQVRKHLFGNTVRLIEPGDLMMVVNNWTRNEQILYNGDYVIIEEINLQQAEEVAGLHFAPAKLKARSLNGSEQTIEDYILLEILINKKPELDAATEKNLRAERFRKNKQYSESGMPEHDRYVGALRLSYGYAITCNKAQGGEWEKVYVNTFRVKDLKWKYTAITRAKDDLELF